MQQLEFRAMGSQMLALIDTDTADARTALAQVPHWFAAWEARLSRFRDDSELMLVNRAAGQPVAVSDTLWEVLRVALDAARDSGGLVTPTVLTAVEQAGYDRSFDSLAPSLSPAELSPAPPPDWHAIRLDARAQTVTLPTGARLDLGGVAKGWAAEQAARRLGEYGPALVDAGGDIAISDPRADGSPWLLGVANPFAPDNDLAALDVLRGGVATSGRDYRRWQQGGQWRHHIIDPRTGQSAATDLISVTVVAPSTSEAEMAAKSALILGSVEGLVWLEARRGLAALLILEDRTMLATRSLDDYLHDHASGL